MVPRTPDLQLERRGACWVGIFRAMASPCEVHLEMKSRKKAEHLLRLAHSEALRIESRFSRYREDNIVWTINNSAGSAVSVDEETARMIDFAEQCFELSEGLFDITSGVLRRVWRFDGSDTVPSAEAVQEVLRYVGWQKVQWQQPLLTIPAGMQLDFGGIGKEYAVDRTVSLLQENADVSLLVNYGGDLHASAPPRQSESWRVGIECAQKANLPAGTLHLKRGALTTSGDAERFVLKDGIRYGHVLNPLTGWPASHAPASITVADATCVEAGVLSTIALLKGPDAESFLDEQGATYWCQRRD
ncbi:MAG: FAD:protein FMN transferase [Granulosicoccus sp.]